MINPASAQSFNTQYPYYQPNFGENFAAMANAYLQSQQAKQASQQESIQKTFAGIAPQWAAQGQIQPGGNMQVGGMNYSGMSVNPNPPPNWNKLSEQALYEEREQKLNNPNHLTFSQGLSAVTNSEEGLKLLKTDPEGLTDKVARVMQSWNEKYGKGIVTEPLPSDLPDPLKFEEGTVLTHPVTHKKYKKVNGQWQQQSGS